MADLPTIEASAPPRTGWRTARRALLAFPTALILLAIVLLVTAQVVRDRTTWLALLMYLPLWPPALAAVAWDLLRLGKALPVRFLLSCIGLATGLLAVGMMWSPALPPEDLPDATELRILHWNTQWGGRRAQQTLDAMVNEMARRRPDILCLSEAPAPAWMLFTWSQRAGHGSTWHHAAVANERAQDYWYRMMVLSRFPVRLIEQRPLPYGHAALFEVDLLEPAGDNPSASGPSTGEDGQPHASAPVPTGATRILRILMIDVQSHVLHPRSPALRAAAEIVESHARAGRPIDVIAGDCNAPARFLGFDALASAGEGYRRAAFWSGQWRATWPVSIQLGRWQLRHAWRLSTLDIDHLLLRRGLRIADAAIFQNDASDHRGQIVAIRLKSPRGGGVLRKSEPVRLFPEAR
ncbi:MAG: endonuclease/exonuclease/phosphatase family protein [Phycisphaerae bacterium]|nr:endonuclease/exonuclease/phosphatase family protein [Phycisphaerae bacterium]MDW8262663.1 endonuclease/exonuclease/phosphatase family protein [Phycisphaerales bacterium]